METNISTSGAEAQTQRNASYWGLFSTGGLRFGHTVVAAVALLCSTAVAADDFDHSHALFDQWLKQNVVNGQVDYKSHAGGSDLLDEYIEALAEPTEADYQSWSEAQQITYWVNAYNAFMIGIVLENYPLKSGFSWRAAAFPSNSVWQIAGVWEKLKSDAAGGRELALNDIEHKILRVDFNEPRIHFGLVCASVGCPALRGEAYTPERLGEQLDEQAVEYFTDDQRGLAITDGGKKVKVSKIFDWFGEDFEQFTGDGSCFAKMRGKKLGVLNFVHQYLPADQAQSICRDKVKLGYLDYDWHLNEQSQ